jgi:hypothetical protein
MTLVTVTKTNSTLVVTSPYSASFAQYAKSIYGKWDATNKAWRIGDVYSDLLLDKLRTYFASARINWLGEIVQQGVEQDTTPTTIRERAYQSGRRGYESEDGNEECFAEYWQGVNDRRNYR